MEAKYNKHTFFTRVLILFALVLLTLGTAFLFGDFSDGKGVIFSIAFSVLGVSFVFGLTNAHVGIKLFLPLIIGLLSLAYTIVSMKETVNSALELFYFTLFYGGISAVSVGVSTVINLIVRAIAKAVKRKKQN
ncbi:MAG: hypothetical protein J6D06_04615 [Clostridia bacterium]|nr:hypothetical protein [Clostridia bacterium]